MGENEMIERVALTQQERDEAERMIMEASEGLVREHNALLSRVSPGYGERRRAIKEGK